MGIDLTLPSDSLPITLEDFKRLGVDLELLFSNVLARNPHKSENSSLFGKTEILDEVRPPLLIVRPRILKPTVKSWCVQPPSTGTSGLVHLGYYPNFSSRTGLHPIHACSPIRRTSRSTEHCISPTTSRILGQKKQDENKQVALSVSSFCDFTRVLRESWRR